MKIENSNLSPLSSTPANSTRRTEKKEVTKDAGVLRTGQDKVEMSGDARLLAKAHAALSSINETDNEKLVALREQVESGNYTVQVTELARKLAAKLYIK